MKDTGKRTLEQFQSVIFMSIIKRVNESASGNKTTVLEIYTASKFINVISLKDPESLALNSLQRIGAKQKMT